MIQNLRKTLDVVFTGDAISPETVPLRTAAEAIAQVQRIAYGEEEVEGGSEGMRLVRVDRGSAIYACAATDATFILDHLRSTFASIASRQFDSSFASRLRPLRELSLIARRLDCCIEVRDPDIDDGVVARIEPDTFDGLRDSLLVSARRTIAGNVQRVGGATGKRCALRVPFQSKLLYCSVGQEAVARRLGQLLYRDVVVTGDCTWYRENQFAILDFKITDLQMPDSTNMLEALDAIRSLAGDTWGDGGDPSDYLNRMTGS